jgi:Kef-type K+ transport system membrane component KefB
MGMVDVDLFLAIAIILFSTKAFSLLVRRLHVPQVTGALFAGVIMGPAIFGLIQPSIYITTLAELGVILLLFTAGMETDYRELRKSLKASILVSVIGLAASLGGGYLISKLFGIPTFESFFIGVVLASMSTSITVETLLEMDKLKTKSGTTIMGAALFDDIIVIMMLAVIMGRGEEAFTIASMSFLLLKIVVFFILAIGAGYGVNKFYDFYSKKFYRTRRLTIFAIAYCFLMAYVAEQLGLADITGAYLAGIAFCNTRCVDYLETRTHMLSYMFFTPVFLANIGLSVSFSAINVNMLLFMGALTIISIVAKAGGCGLGARISSLSTRESLQIGSGMIARGEVSFIVAAKGMMLGVFSPDHLPVIIFITLITIFIAPFLMKLAFKEKEA